MSVCYKISCSICCRDIDRVYLTINDVLERQCKYYFCKDCSNKVEFKDYSNKKIDNILKAMDLLACELDNVNKCVFNKSKLQDYIKELRSYL